MTNDQCLSLIRHLLVKLSIIMKVKAAPAQEMPLQPVVRSLSGDDPVPALQNLARDPGWLTGFCFGK
jgi:hypothetical protein